MLPVVEVALCPINTTFEAVEVYMARLSVVVAHALEPPELVLSAPQPGTPPEILSTWPAEPMPRRESVLAPLAYRMSPVVHEPCPVPPFVAPRVPVRYPTPTDVVAVSLPFASVERSAFARFVNHAEPELENSVVDAFANWFKPVHELLFARSVEEAAVIVMEPAAASEVPLMVPREPVRRLVPIEVVATTRPFWSVARSAEAREVMCKLVVVAFTASVEEAMSCVPLSQRGVVVDWFAVPAYEDGANGHAPPPPPPVWSAAQPNLPAPS
jgi:hypothetical protein